jgi:CRISPR system Cascade subunit CasE
VGENPDRPRPGRHWLRNIYHVHQRLCMAFPSAARLADDPDFLKPFKPEDFGPRQVHVTRDLNAGFLYRIDPHTGGRVVILVQSAAKPDWAYAFHNAAGLLAARPEVKQFNTCFEKGQRLRFRLVANPTRKIDTKSGPDGSRRNGKRVPVRTEKLYDWLARRADSAGFSVEKDSTAVQASYVYFNKPQKRQDGKSGNQEKDKGQRLRSACYDGILKITDPDRFQKTLVQGIGPGKAFGLGLLSLARLA